VEWAKGQSVDPMGDAASFWGKDRFFFARLVLSPRPPRFPMGTKRRRRKRGWRAKEWGRPLFFLAGGALWRTTNYSNTVGDRKDWHFPPATLLLHHPSPPFFHLFSPVSRKKKEEEGAGGQEWRSPDDEGHEDDTPRPPAIDRPRRRLSLHSLGFSVRSWDLLRRRRRRPRRRAAPHWSSTSFAPSDSATADKSIVGPAHPWHIPRRKRKMKTAFHRGRAFGGRIAARRRDAVAPLPPTARQYRPFLIIFSPTALLRRALHCKRGRERRRRKKGGGEGHGKASLASPRVARHILERRAEGSRKVVCWMDGRHAGEEGREMTLGARPLYRPLFFFLSPTPHTIPAQTKRNNNNNN